MTDFTINLLRHDMIYPFVTSFLDAEEQRIHSAYGSDYKRFAASYQVSDDIIGKFKSFIETKKLKLEEDSFRKDAHYITTRMKAYLSRSIWGDEGGFSAMAGVDLQLQKALTLFPEAEKIAGLADAPKGKKIN